MSLFFFFPGISLYIFWFKTVFIRSGEGGDGASYFLYLKPKGKGWAGEWADRGGVEKGRVNEKNWRRGIGAGGEGEGTHCEG